MADQDDDDGLTVALSLVQMAGIMHGKDVSFEATVGNRLWGAVTLFGGALEMTGGSALILTPKGNKRVGERYFARFPKPRGDLVR